MLYGLKTKVTAARLLATASEALRVLQSFDRKLDLHTLRITLPPEPPDKVVTVLALDLAGDPEVQPGLRQQPDAKITLSPAFADIAAPAGEPQLLVDNRGVTTRWFDPAESMSWNFHVSKPGGFEVVLITSEARAQQGGDSWEGGHRVRIESGGQQIEGVVTGTKRIRNERNPRWRDVRTVIGTLRIPRPGKAMLAVRPLAIVKDGNMGFTLRAVQLVPVK